MKRIFIYILLGAVFFSTISCEKWLDVKPDDKVFIDDALSDRQGFNQALSGIYNRLGRADLYGGDLEFGLLDVLAGYWKMNSNNPYVEAYNFNYQHITIQKRFASAWSGLYGGIHQCNMLLANIDNIKEDSYYDIIKGELLGLRAFLHLEVFKLFGPVVSRKGLDSPAVPYYNTAVNTPRPALLSGAFLEQVEIDLQEAMILLDKDPIKVQGREGNGNGKALVGYNSLIDRRGIHMNYYAVLALLARKSQWAGNLSEAGSRAEELIAKLNVTKAVQFMEAKELEGVSSLKDIRFSKENIWGLYINNLSDRTKGYFYEQIPFQQLVPEYSGFLDKIYTQGSGNSLDFRLNLWDINSNSFKKLNIPEFSQTTSSFDRDRFFEVQLINLPELYFIAAEASLENNPSKSLNLLNTVRMRRSLADLPMTGGHTKEQIRGYLVDEVRREYIGEGYLFCFLKHLYNPIFRIAGTISPSDTRFVFPIPDDEYLYNNNL